MFAKKVQYKGDKDKWYFHPEQVKRESDAEMERRLVPAMNSRDIYMMLYAHLISNKIKLFIKGNCFGCSYDAPDQYSHMSIGTGCLQEWEDAVMMNFEIIKPSVNLQDAVKKLNELMTWEVVIPDSINDKELYRIVCNPGDKVLSRLMNVPNDYEQYDLPEAYNSLFIFMDM